MKKFIRKCTSILVASSLCISTIPMASAVVDASKVENPEGTSCYIATEVHTSLDYDTGNKYDIIIPETLDEVYQEPYTWLEDYLMEQETIWESSNEDVWIYNLNASNGINLENSAVINEISYINGIYSISYQTKSNENVVLHYNPDGTIDRYVVDKSDMDAPSLFVYNGMNNSVSQYLDEEEAESYASGTKYDFPTPEDVGFRDTGSKGIVTGTKNVYISQLGENLKARVVEYESDYKKVGSGWKSWTATTSIGALATYYGWGEIALANFLSGLGVGIAIVQGVKTLAESIQLPKYPDYEALDGKYGDIFDTTVYNKYCRVYYNVGKSLYRSGLLANGDFNYVKKGYTGIKSDSEVYNKVQSLFNSCIASYGSNTMYDPV